MIDVRCFANLIHRLLEVGDHPLRIYLAEHHPVDDVADEEADVVQRVIELVRDAGRQLTESRQLGSLHELLLLVAQLLLTPFDGLRGLTQVAHDVDHRLARFAQPQVGLV